MNYIVSDEQGWDHRAYWPYLASVREMMPPHIFAFAADPTNHDLTSPNSLHDAWLESWNIIECGHEKNGTHTVKVEARFLGPRHDRFIHLTYLGVESQEITVPGHGDAVSQMAHGDLLVHEIRLITKYLFSHELVFSGGAVFSLQFRDLVHRVDTLSPAE